MLSIYLSYKIFNKNEDNSIKDKIIRIEDSKLNRNKPREAPHEISNIQIPMNMDLEKWGSLVFDSDNNTAIVSKYKSNLRYYVELEDFSHNIKILTKN